MLIFAPQHLRTRLVRPFPFLKFSIFIEKYFTSRVRICRSAIINAQISRRKYRGANIGAQMLGHKCRGAIIERKCQGANIGAQMSEHKCESANIRCAYVRVQKFPPPPDGCHSKVFVYTKKFFAKNYQMTVFWNTL
jgi:hypothetical protein